MGSMFLSSSCSGLPTFLKLISLLGPTTRTGPSSSGDVFFLTTTNGVVVVEMWNTVVVDGDVDDKETKVVVGGGIGVVGVGDGDGEGESVVFFLTSTMPLSTASCASFGFTKMSENELGVTLITLTSLGDAKSSLLRIASPSSLSGAFRPCTDKPKSP